MDRVVTVVERTGDPALGLRFSRKNTQGVGRIGGHGLFADDVEVVLQTADDVIDMGAVHADDEEGVRPGFRDHLLEVVGEIFGDVRRLRFVLLADLEAQRIDVQHRHEFGTMGEVVEHRFDVHPDGALGNSADGISSFCHDE